jgi:hypothetical protein
MSADIECPALVHLVKCLFASLAAVPGHLAAEAHIPLALRALYLFCALLIALNYALTVRIWTELLVLRALHLKVSQKPLKLGVCIGVD